MVAVITDVAIYFLVAVVALIIKVTNVPASLSDTYN
jgi:hypothetical protein